MRMFHTQGCTIASLHDARTGSFQYIFSDDPTSMAAVIDPVHDFDEVAAAHIDSRRGQALELYSRSRPKCRLGA